MVTGDKQMIKKNFNETKNWIQQEIRDWTNVCEHWNSEKLSTRFDCM